MTEPRLLDVETPDLVAAIVRRDRSILDELARLTADPKVSDSATDLYERLEGLVLSELALQRLREEVAQDLVQMLTSRLDVA